MAAVTIETIQKLKFELLHPAYNPKLAPTSCHIFRLLKDVLHGHQLANNEVNDVVCMWLCAQLKMFFTDGIRKLVDQSIKCVETLGDYLRK
jgi:hypothetical protein